MEKTIQRGQYNTEGRQTHLDTAQCTRLSWFHQWLASLASAEHVGAIGCWTRCVDRSYGDLSLWWTREAPSNSPFRRLQGSNVAWGVVCEAWGSRVVELFVSTGCAVEIDVLDVLRCHCLCVGRCAAEQIRA